MTEYKTSVSCQYLSRPTTVEIRPGEVKDVFPELGEDLLYQFTEKTASGLGVTADVLLNTSCSLFPY